MEQILEFLSKHSIKSKTYGTSVWVEDYKFTQEQDDSLNDIANTNGVEIEILEDDVVVFRQVIEVRSSIRNIKITKS